MKKDDYKFIKIRNAKVHNLKNIDIDIPKNKITVITGPSGSGKSSLAFDTLFIEGQKRFIESLFSSSKHYLDKFQDSSVEKISGLTPAISVEQKTNNLGPRSTVGTQTEIYDYLRVLYSKIATNGSSKLTMKRSPKNITDFINKNFNINEVVCFYIKTNDIKKFIDLGYEKCIANKKIKNINTNDIKSQKVKVILNRFRNKSKEITYKKVESIISAFENELYFSPETNLEKEYVIETKNKSKKIDKITPQTFSFNSPQGYCNYCKGLGTEISINYKNLITDKDLPILNGGISIFKTEKSIIKLMTIDFIQKKLNLKPDDVTISSLNKNDLNLLFDGDVSEIQYNFKLNNSLYNFKDKYPGLKNYILNIYKQNDLKDEFNIIEHIPCNKCCGSRLNKKSLSYKINNYNIHDLSSLEVNEILPIFKKLKLSKEESTISKPLIIEIIKRLEFLNEIGLGYLSLERTANTLSGGESQRIKIATQLGSSLSGVTYILDEPSIGLHPKDNHKLISTLVNLKKLNNTIVIVEHDEEIIKSADFVIDIGPKAGEQGGEIVATGSPKEIVANTKSLTGKYLKENNKTNNDKNIIFKNFIEINNINIRNIKNGEVSFPTNSITTVTGASGSGKSTLVHQVISKAIRFDTSNKNLKHLYKSNSYSKIKGHLNLKQVIDLDQKPIGRSNKSNPSTYLGFFTLIRELFASTPEAKLKGYKAKHFSFNLKDGRCPECEGSGFIKVEMQFLQDVKIKCKTCNGKRYSNKILNIKFKNHDISQILNLTVSEALKVFSNHKKINHFLYTLSSIGLGYIKLGQSSLTMSGGEAQRLKIAKELVKKVKGNTLYILDEPSTGLHLSDIELLQNCIKKLKDDGHTIIIIEHNSRIINISDYVIEMGPGGGKHGGNIVFQGLLSEIEKSDYSITKNHL